MDRRHEIEKIAYELYEKSGRIQGRELDNWVEAERIVSSRYTASAHVVPVMTKKSAPAMAVKKKAGSKETKAASESKTTRKVAPKAKSSKSGTQKEASI